MLSFGGDERIRRRVAIKTCTSRAAVGIALWPFIALADAGPAHPHGMWVTPELPMPESYYWFGAVAVVLLSFVIVGSFVKIRISGPYYATYDLLQYDWLRVAAESTWLARTVGAISVFLLVLTITAGLFGSPVVIWNWTPTFVWVIWWVGFGFIHILFGNVWRVVNPAVAIHAAITRFIPERLRQQDGQFRYPRSLGVWPAFSLLLLFEWVELVLPDSANPRILALVVLGYSLLAVLGMCLFGKEVWLRHGEPFSVFFQYLSALSPTEAKVLKRPTCDGCSLDCSRHDSCIDCYPCFASSAQRQFNLRPFSAGLLNDEHIGFDRVAFIVLMLSCVTFDGLTRTLFWYDLFDIPKPFDPSLYQLAKPALLSINSAGLVAIFFVFLGIYYGIAGCVKFCAKTKRSTSEIASAFVMSLIPIAVVYQVAHYSLYFLLNSQLMLRLISDPFGAGLNLFATRNVPLSYNYDPTTIWNYQVAIIIAGHVIGIYAAHLIAARLFREPGAAIRSQIPMLALMIFYTLLGLWLLSTPSV